MTWFLPHLFCCHDLFTLQNFATCIDNAFLVPNVSSWQLLERQWKIMIWSSAQKEIHLQIDELLYFSYFSFKFILQFLWTCRVLTSYFMILIFFACPYLGASDFGYQLVYPRYSPAECASALAILNFHFWFTIDFHFKDYFHYKSIFCHKVALDV